MRGPVTIQLLWATAGLLVTRFIVLSSQWMNEMRTWGWSEITSCFFVWCEPSSLLWLKTRGTRGVSGADVGGCHFCQRSTPKRPTLISRVEFSFPKMLWIRFSNLSESSWGWFCSKMLRYAGRIFFRIVPFLIQFAIPRNVLTKHISLFWQPARIFSELLYAVCSEAMVFRTVGIGRISGMLKEQ